MCSRAFVFISVKITFKSTISQGTVKNVVACDDDSDQSEARSAILLAHREE